MEKLLKIMNLTAISFTVFILVTSAIGFFLSNDIELYSGFSSIFVTPESVRYVTIFQCVLACFSISIWSVIVEESKVFRNMMFLWKFVLQISVSLFIIVVYIILFDWFLLTSIQSWISFCFSFLISMGVAISLVIYKTRKKDKHYQALLQEYKKNHKGD